MTRSRPRFSSVAIFILFFGIGLYEALARRNLLEASVFALVAVLSLAAVFRRK